MASGQNSVIKRRILIINPNTTKSMTDALKPLTSFSLFTAPAGVASINNDDPDALVSAEACLPSLKPQLNDYDGFLVCCYSQHPLVPQLRQELKASNLTGKIVTGILEASIATSLQSIDIDSKFGIVSTGKQWEEILGHAVSELLGSSSSTRYAGTETTSLNADELHTTAKDGVDGRMKDATKRLLKKGAKAICLGCAGMAGMEEVVREACLEELGEVEGRRIKIIDGVVSGVIFLEGALRAGV